MEWESESGSKPLCGLRREPMSCATFSQTDVVSGSLFQPSVYLIKKSLRLTENSEMEGNL